ncbi:hypothetical protein D3C79_518630 [compost metagenome]
MPQAFGHRLHDIGVGQHADLGAVDAHVAEYRIQLGGDKRRIDVIYRLHATGILRHQRGDHGSAVSPQGRKGFQIGLDAGAAARIGAGDGQSVNPFHCSSSARS